MSYISLYFIGFVFLVMGIYYLMPQRFRYIVLLLASLAFYVQSSPRALIYVLISFLAAYVSAIMMERIYSGDGDGALQKSRARRVFFPAAALILTLLVLSKAVRFMPEGIKESGFGLWLLVPLGISYYTFSLLGYLADVLWRKDGAEKNPAKLLLYTIYFPQIVEGPIPRHSKLAEQLSVGGVFDFKRICFGLQRALWGFFKKLIVADRAAVIVGSVFGQQNTSEGFIPGVSIMLSALMLYADFSGCMDIALGVSECFGITLSENFSRPFFSLSAAQFWRRWHITLGSWFRDYVCMPVTLMGWVKKLSKKARKKWGKEAGRNVTTSIALAVTWICTGIWHGTGWGYVMWGIYWGAILICSTVFEKKLTALRDRLKIDSSQSWYRIFCMFRTFLLFCIGRLLGTGGSVSGVLRMIRRIFGAFNPWVFFDGSFYELGLKASDLQVMLLGLMVMLLVSILQERGVVVREKVAQAPVLIRWPLYIVFIFVVLIFGYYGAGFDAASFVYAGF